MAVAALSPETAAIVQKLKDEGELIRNRGINSLRALNVKLDKFDGLFSSINANMVEQTKLLERQIGLSDRADVRLKNQEQFDELKRSEPEKETEEPKGRDDTNIDKFGDAIGKAFTMQSLKNVAMVAGGAFIGYNLIKGAIDSKTNGGFSAFESGIGNFARGLGELDFEAIKTDFSSLKTSIAGIATSLASLSAAIDVITSLDWQTIVSGVLKSIGILTAYNLTMKAAIMLMGANKIFGGKGRFFRALLGAGVGANVLSGLADTDVDRAALGEARANADGRLSPAQADAIRGTGAHAPVKAPSVMSTLDDTRFNYSPLTDEYRSKSTGQVLTGAARDSAEQARIRRMPRLPNPAMSDIPFTAPSNPRVITPTVRPKDVADDFIRNNKTSIARSITRKLPGIVAKSVPVLGLFVGLGFMVWSISKADWTSAALEGSSLMLPGFTGLPLDVTAAATSVFNEVTGRTYLNTEIDRAIMLQIADMIHDAYMAYMQDASTRKRREFDALPMDERAAREAEAEYIAGGGRPGARGMGNNNTGTMSLGSYSGPDNQLRNSSSFQGSYYMGPNGQMMFVGRNGTAVRAGSAAHDRMINERLLESGGGGGTVVIHAPTNVSPTVNTIQGAKTQNSMTILQGMGGGGGEGFGGAVGLPYFVH